jgi:hypothetical protein
MGLLDDAIREHLELKRRRGADPGEIERLEREALGPVRRPGYEANEMPVADEPGPQFSELDDQPTEFWSGPDDEPDAAGHDAEFVREAEDWGASDIADTGLEPDVGHSGTTPPPPDEAPPRRGFGHEEQVLEEDTVEHDLEGGYATDPGDGDSDHRGPAYPEPPGEVYPEPEERGRPAPPEPGGPQQQQHEESQHPEHEPSQHPEREDMLEETPEFLQDAPDHDRLWFEQRPPRDFDLDG